MITIYLGATGLLAFILGTGILGIRLRNQPSQVNAEKFSRIMHFLFFAGLGMPFLISIFYPGITNLDGLLGLKPLPWKFVFLVVGIIIGLPGLYFLGMSNKSLRALGSGANAFRLTKKVVEGDIYKYTRNPMSLGYYLSTLGLSFITGSALLTLYVILGLIPAHLFFLKFFEERELELRLGKEYRAYKQKTPFLFPTTMAK
jgi:protein-S-isoprenylcysteine O-methyltransferase Ste14